MIGNINGQRKVLSANIHVNGVCNYRCAHCFSTCLSRKYIRPEEWKGRLEYLGSIGITKVNIAGGEPMLYPYLYEMCDLLKSMDFIVSIVSNGSLIDRKTVRRLSETVDWIGLSIDSPDEEDEIRIGRHCNGVSHLEHIVNVAGWAHGEGMKVKLNITVLRQSWNKDFSEIIRRTFPERIKAFRALTLTNANDSRPDTWSITDEQFAYFRKMHQGIPNMVFEDNSDMIGTYLMFDPVGRWMLNTGGEKHFLPFEDFRNTDPANIIDLDGYYKREGVYRWGD